MFQHPPINEPLNTLANEADDDDQVADRDQEAPPPLEYPLGLPRHHRYHHRDSVSRRLSPKRGRPWRPAPDPWDADDDAGRERASDQGRRYDGVPWA